MTIYSLDVPLALESKLPTAGPPGKPYYAKCIMWNARLEEAQAGIKIARRNIHNLRYADATALMGESEKELKGFLMRMKQ